MSTSLIEKYDWFLSKSNIERKEYQLQGIQWCVNLETHSDPSLPVHGGFIADEMGLGKTIMMISTFIINIVPRTLIVLPNILLEQWQSEIFRTTGHRALIYHGANKKKISLAVLKSSLIVLTTYSAIAVAKKNPILTPIHEVEWSRVVFDEAHHLRNKNTRWIGAKLLKSDIRWLISGTPIQNKRKDFYHLCSVLGLPASYYADKKNIIHLVSHFVLKRTKKQVGISLPSLDFGSETISWSSTSERKLALDIHNAIPSAGPSLKLKLMLHARQTCVLPSLLKDNIPNMVSSKIINQKNASSAILSSSKLDAVIHTILQRKDNGNGKLVFCHFRGEIDSIVQRLRDGGISSICAFDGRISQTSRFLKLKEQFQVIVLQIQTGCEGLNLQKDFCEVYFVSPHWNPSIEDQAVARCHRIGQTKPVSVFRFAMDMFEKNNDSPELNQYTIDQYISTVQTSKRDISSHMLTV